MPIDFNPHVIFNPFKNITHKVAHPSFLQKQPEQDTYIKSIKTDTPFDYSGIKISKKPFGTLQSGESVDLYTITNKNGASVDFSTFGATITSIKVPDKDGKIKDITQGYNDVTPYETAPVGHAGGTIGPCANKISDGKFTINGEEYSLETNKDNGKSHCHGGSQGMDVRNWKARVLKDGIKFTYLKKDMESGYPGNVETSVTYKFDNENNLRILYNAKTDKDTLLNLTNHTYFNLDGAENAQENSVLNHLVILPNSSKITENSEIAIPTGKILDVENTPFDFRTEKRISDVINSDNEQIKIGTGFDQNYCIDNYDGKNLVEIADVKSETTGIKLKVSTNLPGFQFYTANHLGKAAQPEGKDGKRYEKRSALCIEPQIYPNAINTESFKEKGILKAGEEYNKEIRYSFSAENF